MRNQQTAVELFELSITVGMVRSREHVLYVQDATNILEELGRDLFPILGGHPPEQDPKPRSSALLEPEIP